MTLSRQMKSNQTNSYKPHLLLGKTNKQIKHISRREKEKKYCEKKYTLNTEKLYRNKKEQTEYSIIYVVLSCSKVLPLPE